MIGKYRRLITLGIASVLLSSCGTDSVSTEPSHLDLRTQIRTKKFSSVRLTLDHLKVNWLPTSDPASTDLYFADYVQDSARALFNDTLSLGYQHQDDWHIASVVLGDSNRLSLSMHRYAGGPGGFENREIHLGPMSYTFDETTSVIKVSHDNNILRIDSLRYKHSYFEHLSDSWSYEADGVDSSDVDFELAVEIKP